MDYKSKIEEKRLTIKVNVAGRFYSLSIKRGEEYREELIRKAAESINKKIEQYRGKFASYDTQDYLAIASLQIVKELIAEKDSSGLESIIEDIKDLNEEIDQLQED